MDISIVIPLYNESESVKLIGGQLNAEFIKTGKSLGVIFIDDGRKDYTFV